MSTPSSGNRLPSAVARGGTGTTSTPANSGAGLASTNTGRRSSASSGGAGLFSGLLAQKRNPNDGTAEARRMSINDQKPTPGFLGQWWNNVMRGASAK